MRGLLSLAAAAATLASTTPAPDAHDRALAARLRTGIATLRKVSSPRSSSADEALKIDLCDAATVILDMSSTAADWRRVLGYGQALVSKLFAGNADKALAALDPEMRAFLVAAGLSPQSAKTLTS